MTLIEKIKALFAESNIEATAETEKFLDAKLVDGTIIRTDAEEFKPGDKLFVITEDGEKVQAPEGMHETTEGMVIVVDAEGTITEVRKPEVETEETPSEEKMKSEVETKMEEAPVKEEKTAEPTEMEVLASRVQKLEEALAMLVSEMEMKKTEMSELTKENEALKIKNEELSKAPIVKPTETKRFEKVLKETNKETKVNAELLSKISAIRKK